MRNKTIEAISFPGDAAEWQARVDLAACFRLIALFSWDDLLATHVSAQVPGTDHEFLVGTAVSALETGLLLSSKPRCWWKGTSPAIRSRASRSIWMNARGFRPILARATTCCCNHGTLATGRSVAEAFIHTYTLEKAWAALLRRLTKAGSDHDR